MLPWASLESATTHMRRSPSNVMIAAGFAVIAARTGAAVLLDEPQPASSAAPQTNERRERKQ